ncbi:MAG: ABA4-like family protein [Pseudomonadota bacterium]
MNYETLFSTVGLIAMSGWIALLLSPIKPKWSDLYAGLIAPLVLSAVYIWTVLMPNTSGGGFGSFAEVSQLFTSPNAVMAGWIHFLAFDLFVGAWICRRARQEQISFWLVLPTLPLTLMYGPAGFLAFCGVRGAYKIARSAKPAM